MAPGNMKSEIVGPQRVKIEGRPGVHRKNMSRNSAVYGEMPSTVTNHLSNHDDNNTNVTSKSFAQDVSNSKELCTSNNIGRSDSEQTFQEEEERTRLESQVKHLKELLLLHLDLIQEQQQQLLAKDREVKTLRTERDTLKCRLERMERRMSLAHKSSKSQETESPQKRQISTQLQKRKSSDECTTPGSKRFHKTPSAKVVDSTKNSEKLRTDKQQNWKRREKEDRKEKDEKLLWTNVHYFSQNRIPPVSCDIGSFDEPVLLPEWRINIVSTVPVCDGMEDITDEAYNRRHQKLEIDEKKRKRWDIQRIRELRQHEKLERKLLKKDQQLQILTTFRPNTYEAECIEVQDLLPVSVFSQPLPSIQQTDFVLPWFDIKARAKEEKQRPPRRSGNKK
ncbi:uncharacterized protein LOC144433988 [Glandiceps talaboti]